MQFSFLVRDRYSEIFFSDFDLFHFLFLFFWNSPEIYLKEEALFKYTRTNPRSENNSTKSNFVYFITLF
jgi:hypothetical protein